MIDTSDNLYLKIVVLILQKSNRLFCFVNKIGIKKEKKKMRN